jgi:hypothetical protein
MKVSFMKKLISDCIRRMLGCHSVQNIFLFRQLEKTIILPVVLYWCETWNKYWNWNKYYLSGHYPSSCFHLKTRRFGDLFLSRSSGKTYSVGHFSSLKHALSLLSLLSLHQSFSGNGFQRHIFFCFSVHAVTARRLSPNYLKSRSDLLITPRHGPHRKHLFEQLFYYGTQLSHGPRREHGFPVSPLVRVRNLLPSNGSTYYSIQ